LNSTDRIQGCGQVESASAYALHALAANERTEFESHLASCAECRREVESLGPVVGLLADWPSEVLQPSVSLWSRLSRRIAPAGEEANETEQAASWVEPKWEQAAPGISVRMLATDAVRHRVSMLVRLAPGVAYPPHSHSGVEELHLLDGELWIEDRKLLPGDYNRAEPGTSDQRVWSETGCTCVLITSARDTLL
jgi:anti-sigma factor ChrR (cupin superfamily)